MSLVYDCRIGGGIYVTCLSLGNYNGSTRFEIILGTLFTVLLTIIPKFFRFDFIILSNITSHDTRRQNIISWVHFIFGCIIIFQNVLSLIHSYVSNEMVMKNVFVSKILKGTERRMETEVKQAATFKVNSMIKNAYNLHMPKNKNLHRTLEAIRGSSRRVEESTHIRALLNFTKEQEERELTGGFLWSWKNFLNGDLLDREGIWIHTRIIASNFAQVRNKVMYQTFELLFYN